MGEGRAAYREPTIKRDNALPVEGYELRIEPDAIVLTARDDAGEQHGRNTLAQLVRVHADGLPVATINDWPDLAVRAVMLDISRDKVPSMATLEDLVVRLSSWKINQLQLYIEHTFAYDGHEKVWANAGALTSDEIRHLDAFCRRHYVELVPNQNCLGHMGRWLRHERYRSLALTPDGFTDMLGRTRPPMTLDPANPGSLALVRELLGQLVPCFTSSRVHVGLDEPWELADERVGDYLEWIAALRALPELAGREMLVWGDLLSNYPERLEHLPTDVTVCEWGYEDWHPFDERAASLAAAGANFYVCPGTSTWMTMFGRTTNMLGDCANAAAAALAHGAEGYLNTDWGDQGHLQYLPVSEPGFAYGAAVAWCLESNRDLDLAAALDAHAFFDSAGELGGALLALGDVYREVPLIPNVSGVTLHLYFPQQRLGRGPTNGITDAAIDRVEDTVAGALDRLERARSARPDAGLVLDELRTSAALVQVLCRDAHARLAGDGSLASVPQSVRRELATALDVVVDAHRDLWLARNRPGGLADSVRWLTHLRDCYETGVPQRDWGSAYVG